MPAPSQVLIAQLTDTHVMAADPALIDMEVYVDNNARLREAVRSILAEQHPPAAVVATGDLTNDARPEEYDALVDLLEPVIDRLLPLPGNHDLPSEVRRRFPHAPWVDADHASWSTTVDGVRLVGLDTTHSVDGRIQHGGAIDETRAAWLDAALAEPHDGVTVLAMHHPPFASGIWWMDQYGFAGLPLLEEIVSSRRPDRIMCGHLHRPMTTTFGGVLAQVGMSTVQHVGLDLVIGDQVTVADEPAGYQLLQVREHDVHVGETSGPRSVLHHRYVSPTVEPIIPIWESDFR